MMLNNQIKTQSMCIAVFMWQSHPCYPFLLLLNRDEYHTRPTEALGWWEGGEILGGRDGLAGGTWLACSKDGKLAFLTNFREVRSTPQAKTRGDLPAHFLQSKKSPMEFAEEITKVADQYNGFNLILTDVCSKTMVYVTNRPKDGDSFITEVSTGVHVLTNANLDPAWPKAQRLGNSFNELLNNYGESELPMKEMAAKLMTNTIKDDESLLPHIYPFEREYHLSSIFVDMDSPLGRYGTRSTSAVSVKPSGEVCFYERRLENDLWKEQTITFQVVNMK
ncbi:NRDE domain-containing protein [Cephalotus follicularis]|uniref:NRDE domain-containing protein n=1 Tax=Cephalotus follicularis TaxID=3775 RepID=A0A1Q3D923_CEPFO|nr:NRDE domain-containing protein [Cephalotus follicularis]